MTEYMAGGPGRFRTFTPNPSKSGDALPNDAGNPPIETKRLQRMAPEREMKMSSDKDRLMNLLFGDPDRQLVNFHVTPGNKPGLTEDDVYKAAADSIERARAYFAAGGESKPPVTGRKKQHVLCWLADEGLLDYTAGHA